MGNGGNACADDKGKSSWYSYILSKTWWMAAPSALSSSEESRKSSSLARNWEYISG